MKDAVLCFAGSAVPAARALAEGPALAASLGDDGPRVAIYGAGLAGETIALGAWQRRAAAEVPDDAGLVRRRTGGIACRAGDGIVYVALGLRTASELLPCPRDRVLNRNVRGLLAGLSASGVPAHYFGRDFVSIAHRPAAMVAWDRDREGRVLIEAFIARASGLGVGKGATERWMGKAPITLVEAWSREPSAEEVVRLVAEKGYARFDLALRELSSPPAPSLSSPSSDTDALDWSASREIPIGVVQAGLALDTAGLIADAALAGDFMQDRDAPERLRARLVGQRPERTLFAGALNATYGAAGDAVIEGVRSLETLLDAFGSVGFDRPDDDRT